MAVVVFLSTTVSILVNRIFNSSDTLTNDHFTLANLSKTVESIIVSVNGKVDEKVYQADQRNINDKLTAIEKKQDATLKMIEAIANRQQASAE